MKRRGVGVGGPYHAGMAQASIQTGAEGRMVSPEDARRAAEEFRTDFARAKEMIGRAVVGQSEIIEGVLTGLFVGGHVLLEGVPGIGKTLLVRSIAQAVRLDFSRIQFTPDLMPADISGTTVVAEFDAPGGGKERRFVFQKGPIFGQIVLADEVNRATPKTQSALLEAMQERCVTVGGVTHQLPRPFLVLATQNPVEQEGTYPLPEAQLDRFMLKLLSTSPNRSEMGEILNRTTAGSEPVLEPVLDAERILSHQRLVRQVAIAPSVQDYAVRLVLATQPSSTLANKGASMATPMVEKYVRLGASPRAAQSLVLAAKCRALVDGRAAASVDDLRAVAMAALRHRIIMNFESFAEGVTADRVVANIVETLPRELN